MEANYPFLFAMLSALILGFAKAGFKGLGFIIVTLMALTYESKASTGILLPLLVMGDIMAIIYYRNDVNWRVLKMLFPPIAVGIIIGTYVGDELSVERFRQVMAVIIFMGGVMILVLQQIKTEKIPDNRVFATLMGLGAGFTTMVGNLAGAFVNIYFLAMKFPKREFIGTAAWLFFFANLFKLPFHIFSWGTINMVSVQEDLYLAPFVAIGFWIGLQLINRISNRFFVRYIVFMTMFSAVLIWVT